MKEITRIHIAKVAYDIELAAKKDIEQYMAALERYANDPDILGDIEIRVTELLAERGVQGGGVITEDDVAAVRAQLGEPSDFASDDVEPIAEVLEPSGEQARRVYRDTDNAMLGGVLAGLAKYFGTDPLWLRLVFIVLLFASFGTAIIVYLVLWLIVPPAETAAEKLRMGGQAVTLASIKELVKREDRQGERSRVAQRALSVFGGFFLVLTAIGGLLAIIAVVFGIRSTGIMPAAEGWEYGPWWFMAMLGLFIVSGLLFATLCFILASAAFQRQWTKRIGTAVTVIVAVGLVSFAGGAALGMVGYVGEQERIADLTQTRRVEPAADIKDVEILRVSVDRDTIVESGAIEYVVSSSPRFEMSGMPGVEPMISVADDGKTMDVKLVQMDEAIQGVWGYLATSTLTIYGPALDRIDVASDNQSVRYYNGQAQDTLDVVGESGSFNLAGTYKSLRVTSKNTTAISLRDAAIESLEVDLAGGSVTAGVVRTLTVKQSDVCPARQYHDERGSLQVQAVSSGKMTYNGNDQAAASKQTECGAVLIGNDEDDSYNYEEDAN